MAWAKLDDHFHSHPKVMDAGLAAVGLYTKALSYCACYLTDGVVSEYWVESQFGPKDNALEITTRLVESGLWEEKTEGYYIPDYLEFNPSREQVLEAREKTRARVARHRRNADGNDAGNSVSNAAPVPDPTPKEKETPNGVSKEVKAVYEHWHRVMGKNGRTSLTADRRRKIEARLKEFSVADLKLAVDGVRLDTWHMGDNPRGRAFNDFGTIFRNAQKVNGFIELATKEAPSERPKRFTRILNPS